MEVQRGNNNIRQGIDIRNVILNAIINFRTLSRELRHEGQSGNQLSNLALYTLLLLLNNSSILRNDIVKKFHVNYYDAGSAIDQLITKGLIVKESNPEKTSIKSITINRVRYRISLNGEIFINSILEAILNKTLI